MAGADTGMSGQRTNGNRMVQQQRNQIKHILHPIKKVREELLSQQPELQKIVPVSVSTELSDNNVVEIQGRRRIKGIYGKEVEILKIFSRQKNGKCIPFMTD